MKVRQFQSLISANMVQGLGFFCIIVDIGNLIIESVCYFVNYIATKYDIQIKMGSCIASGLCCCFSCCCQQCSDSLKKLLGPERVTKLFYLILVIVFVVPTIVIFFFLYNWTAFQTYFSTWLSCPASSGPGYLCIGSSSVYRLSLAVLALFFIMLLFMLCRNRCAMVINQGLFCFKYLFVVGLFIGFLWISNDVFQNYATASQYISIVFMILQSIILIDLFYLAGIKLVKRYDEGQSCYAGVLVILTLIFQALAILMNVLGYVYFNSYTCGNTLWLNIITTIILIILPVLQLFNFNHQNSLLTTSMVSAYVSYLAFICQYSYSNDSASCSRMTTPSMVADILVSTFMFGMTMYGSIMGGSGQVKVTQGGDLNKAMGVAPTEAQPPKQNGYQIQPPQNPSPVVSNESDAANNEASYQSWAWVKWHFYMCLASIYIAMLITNWNSASIITNALGSSGFGFWVRAVLSWTTAILYVWTLIAPKVFPQRDFTVE